MTPLGGREGFGFLRGSPRTAIDDAGIWAPRALGWGQALGEGEAFVGSGLEGPCSPSQDFQFILKGTARLLSNPLLQTYLPNSTKKIQFHQELLVLFWKLCDFNKVGRLQGACGQRSARPGMGTVSNVPYTPRRGEGGRSRPSL